MKVMMIMKWDAVTLSQYEQARKIVNWEGHQPKGAILHLCSFGNNALHVTDIWESAEDFNNFVEKRLMPGVQQVGIQGQPQVEIFPVHAIYAPELQQLK